MIEAFLSHRAAKTRLPDLGITRVRPTRLRPPHLRCNQHDHAVFQPYVGAREMLRERLHFLYFTFSAYPLPLRSASSAEPML